MDHAGTLFAVLVTVLLLTGCGEQEHSSEHPILSREAALPHDREKVVPAQDRSPPVMHSDEFEEPVPVADINTAGAEDSPFIHAKSNDLYFFFTPDVRVPVEKQLVDNVTGIYLARWENGAWQAPRRVWLQEPGKLSLDGCAFVQDALLLFCTVREGYTGVHWFSATRQEGQWGDWQQADFPSDFEVGELHIHQNTLYYHSSRTGGKGGLDIWTLTREEDSWKNPANLAAVNTEADDGWPYITPHGKELWLTRTYQGTPALFRSLHKNGTWTTPTLMVSSFAGEPTLDQEGNLYFVHHYYREGEMIEADLYVAYRKNTPETI